MPIVASSDLDPALRDDLRQGRNDIFHALILAKQQNLLLVADDLIIRSAASAMGHKRSTWTAQLLSVAVSEQVADFDDYVQWLAHLIGAGHNYLSVNSLVLIRALKLSVLRDDKTHELFKAASSMIGGSGADAQSHLSVSLGFLAHVWRDRDLLPHREKVTALLMRNLIRGRYQDCVELVAAIISFLAANEEFIAFMQVWVRGHFLPEQAIWETATGIRVLNRECYPRPQFQDCPEQIHKRNSHSCRSLGAPFASQRLGVQAHRAG